MSDNFSFKINVCHIVLSLDVGGLEKVVVKLCETIDRNAINPSIVCLDKIGILGEELIEKNIKADYIKRKGPLDLLLIKKLVDYFNINSIDIVHSHSGCMLYSTFAGKLSNAKAVVHTDHGRHFPERKVVVAEEFLSSLFIDKIISVSSELRDYLTGRLHFPVNKVVHITNGIDVKEFFAPAWNDKASMIKRETGINNDDFVIGTVGRLTPVKNQSLLIKAFATVLRENNKSCLVIVGDGPEMNTLKNLSNDLNISGKVLFLGERRDIPQILSMFDIFVLPSLSEGTSVTLLEALSSCVPVIASNIGGNPRIIINGETGLLFESGNIQDLADKICRLISDSSKAQMFAERGRERIIKQYSISEMNKKYLSLYSSYMS